MALSGFFLLVFLLQHMAINSLSICSEEAFNSVSHFMGTNPLIQYVMQPVLALGVIFHLMMGLYLDMQNKKARKIKYAQMNGGAAAPWVSRNMVITGIMILLFLGLHFVDFWIHEINIKYVAGDMSGMNAEGGFRYYEELQHKFTEVWRVAIYCLAFIFLSLHLMHGFQSAFQSVGFRHNKYTPTIKKLGNIYAVIVPLGFIVIALYHYVTQL